MFYNLIDVAYLPDIKTSLLDDCNLTELDAAFKFCVRNKVRSFCTYLDLIPLIDVVESSIRLSPVIDFPFGYSCTEAKLFDAGRAHEICRRKAIASEIDVVLSPNESAAIQDIKGFSDSGVNSRIPVKFIIELGNRDDRYFESMMHAINNLPDSCTYVKTNTGKAAPIPYTEKKQLVKRLLANTDHKIKISGGIEGWDMMKEYLDITGGCIFGVSYSKIKDW
jgi:deoxyribose-phosphate aldolase